MCRHIKISIIVFLITLLAVGCEEDNIENNPVSFDFQLLDEQGNSFATIDVGCNFYFSFLIKNNTEKDMSFLGINDMSTFFEVFKTDDAESSNAVTSYGKPYKAIYCDTY